MWTAIAQNILIVNYSFSWKCSLWSWLHNKMPTFYSTTDASSWCLCWTSSTLYPCWENVYKFNSSFYSYHAQFLRTSFLKVMISLQVIWTILWKGRRAPSYSQVSYSSGNALKNKFWKEKDFYNICRCTTSFPIYSVIFVRSYHELISPIGWRPES